MNCLNELDRILKLWIIQEFYLTTNMELNQNNYNKQLQLIRHILKKLNRESSQIQLMQELISFQWIYKCINPGKISGYRPVFRHWRLRMLTSFYLLKAKRRIYFQSLKSSHRLNRAIWGRMFKNIILQLKWMLFEVDRICRFHHKQLFRVRYRLDLHQKCKKAMSSSRLCSLKVCWIQNLREVSIICKHSWISTFRRVSRAPN